MLSHLLELLVPSLYDEDDPGVGVEDDEGGQVEGSRGGVDDVVPVLIVLAGRLVVAVAVRVRPARSWVTINNYINRVSSED